eukprot:Rhum_TRINITY_DN14221_c18_g1::Rhum_TRINITY_DN14221_c18_g1_i1::g.74942::m.74942
MFVEEKPMGTQMLGHLASNIPDSVFQGMSEVLVKYPDRVKDQFNTAVLFLDDHFPPETLTHRNYSSLSLPDRWAQPLASHGDKVVKLFHKIIDQSTDDLMWNALIRDLIEKVFGRDGCRADAGSHYLGSRFALQVLLKHRPSAFAAKVEAVEQAFYHDSGLMDSAGAANYAWVLANLPDSAAPHAVASYVRVFFPRVVANEGRATGKAVDAAFALADALATRTPSEEVKKAFRVAAKNKDPLQKEIFQVLPLLAPKMNRHIRLMSSFVPAYSVFFTPTSAHLYFTKLAQQLRTANAVSRPIILDLIVDAIVQDSTCLPVWGNDFPVVVVESALILEHIAKQSSRLSSRLDGAELARLFEKLQGMCKEPPVLEGKKAKQHAFTPQDIASVEHWLRKCSGLSKAVPRDAPASNKRAQKKVQEVDGRQAGGGAGSAVLTLLAVVATLFLMVWLALPFMPKEHSERLLSEFAKVQGVVQKQYTTIFLKA